MVLINYVATSHHSHRYFLEKDSLESGAQSFLEFLIQCATQDEFQGAGKKTLLTTKDEDIELKKLLLTGILYVTSDTQNNLAHQTLIETSFFGALLLFLDPNASQPSIARYQPGQLRELQLHALAVLTNLLVLLPEHFHS
jgi:hypothetical protein